MENELRRMHYSSKGQTTRESLGGEETSAGVPKGGNDAAGQPRRVSRRLPACRLLTGTRNK